MLRNSKSSDQKEKSTVAELRAKFAENQVTQSEQGKTIKEELRSIQKRKEFIPIPTETTNNNTQKNTVQADLEFLRSRKKSSPPIELSPPMTDKPSSYSAVEELKSQGFTLDSTKKRLLQEPTKSESNQKMGIKSELENLQVGNVQNKTKHIAELFTKKVQGVTQAVVKNKVSQKAKESLSGIDLDSFNKNQESYINDINLKMLSDQQNYARSVELQKLIQFDEFFELSFYYRAYQVCLTQDFYRHAVERLQEKDLLFKNDAIGLYCAATNRLAIESLNYYQNFFEKLPEIEKHWPGAGADIRNLEVKLMYAGKYADLKLLFNILHSKDNEKNKMELEKLFENFYQSFIRNTYEDYISKGDGLDKNHHPWTKNNCNRLPQANDIIDFTNIAPVDRVHAKAKEEIENKVLEDLTKRFCSSK